MRISLNLRLLLIGWPFLLYLLVSQSDLTFQRNRFVRSFTQEQIQDTKDVNTEREDIVVVNIVL